MSNEFKKLSEVDILEELSENAHVIVEDGGVTRRYTAAGVGGSSAATIFTKDWDDETGEYVCACNKTFEECLEDYNNANLNVFVKGILSSGYHTAISYEVDAYDGEVYSVAYRFWDTSYNAQAVVTYYPNGDIYIEDNTNGGE